MAEAKKFINFTDRDFIGMWDSVEYEIKAGQSLVLPGYLADHFAKHLVDREMILSGKDMSINIEEARKPFLTQCFVGEVIEAKSELEAEIKALNTEIATSAEAEEVLEVLNPAQEDAVTDKVVMDGEQTEAFKEIV